MVGLPGLVIAEPSAGKTTFALSIAKGKGQAGGKTLYISLDGIARIYGAENYENIKLVEMTRPTIDEIRNVFETMCAEREYSLAVVDYINLIEGDDIIGYISRGRGVTIHRLNCPNLKFLEPERLIDAQWQVKENATFMATIKVVAEKADNNLGRLTNLITGLKINIRGFDAKDVGDSFVCSLRIEVKNKTELESAINSIRNLRNVTSVYRSEKW